MCVFLDAAAGAGSTETKGGQPDGSGCHRPQEEEEVSGFSILFLCGGRTLFVQEDHQVLSVTSELNHRVDRFSPGAIPEMSNLLPSLLPSPPLPPTGPELAGIGAVSVSLQQRWLVGLQARAAAHHTCQPQGLALLFGEREIQQPLPFPLQELSQVGFTWEE